MNTCYAIFRLPDAGLHCHIIEAEQTCVLSSPLDIDGRQGFIIAPFENSPLTPIILIDGEAQPYSFSVPEKEGPKTMSSHVSSTDRTTYHDQFAIFHEAIVRGKCSKIVLARRCTETSSSPLPPRQLFHRACTLFPHCFVALFCTPETGTWLTATPEILLEQTDGQAHTMALAGTMPAPDNEDTGLPWSKKNRREQRYVADYLRTQLTPLTDRLEETKARTIVAGNVMHLRSDFRFILKKGYTLGEAVNALHPTPAVCGTPTQAAHDFILTHEQLPRAYYSGYCGPINTEDTHLYVMLRCMHICGNSYNLYAGGGLVKESIEQDEWEETEAKFYAMRRVKEM